MPPHEGLRELEHLVLLAMARLDQPVHGVPIVRELERTVRRSISRASIYVVLRRLEARGLITSAMGESTPERGGRAKRLYTLTPAAVRALRAAQRDFVRLWQGSRVLVLASLLFWGSATVAAQKPPASTMPNLSGTWISISDANATDVATAARLPYALLKIAHDGARLDIERSWTNAPITARFVCDGARENRNGYSTVVERTTCRWDPADGGQFVIEGTLGSPDGEIAGRMRERYRLDTDGTLRVERTREAFVLKAEPRTTTARYRKVKP